jgi:polyhydroxyalkanoate synthase subunit PhaC
MNPAEDTPPSAPQSMSEAGQLLFEKFLRDLPAGGIADFRQLLQRLPLVSASQTTKLREIETRFYSGHMALWMQLLGPPQPATGGETDVNDPRFKSPEWAQLPYFRYVREAYALNSRFLAELGDLAELAPNAKRRLQFVLKQIADAASPANFAATNPEALRLAAETRGESTARGMQLLAADLARGRISMTDESAFEVGRNLALTPGSVVLENEVMQLIQYAPATDVVFERPLLIVPPFINKYYILDLQPENSFVRYCVERGFTTYIVSWRNIPPELGRLSWDDYVEKGVLAPIRAARTISGSSTVNTLGFCVGGTLLACALAVLAGQGEQPAASLTLLASMLDFSDTGDISVYVDQGFVEQAERDHREGGVMPGNRLAATFATLRANDLIWRFVVDSYLKGRKPQAFDLLYWNADGSNLPGRLYCWYLRNMYLENNLKIPGKLQACGVPLDLGAIRVDAYVLATREDHIVPWRSAYLSARLLGGRTEFVLGASGHVAGIVNPASRNRRSYWINPESGSNADEWASSAGHQQGSWWTHWADWLGRRSGARINAPASAGNPDYPPVEPAPGRYVRERGA